MSIVEEEIMKIELSTNLDNYVIKKSDCCLFAETIIDDIDEYVEKHFESFLEFSKTYKNEISEKQK